MSRVASVAAVVLVLGALAAAPVSAQEKGKQEAKPAAKPAAAQWKTPPVVKHSLEGRSNCIMCHSGAMKKVPAMPKDHAGRTVKECLLCHGPDAEVQKTEPPHIPHELEGRSQCLMCHKPGAMKAAPDAPASHAGRTNDMCPVCHRPAKPEQEKEKKG